MVKKLYYCLLFLFCFEEVLSYTNLPLSTLKYLVSFSLVLILIKRGYKMPKTRILGINIFIILLIIALFRAFPNILNNDFEGIIVWKNYLWFPVLLFLYSNMQKSSNIQINEYLQKFADIMCLYIITNITLYYVHIPILITNPHRYWGRLTVGYPTIDVILIGFAIAVVFFAEHKWNNKAFLLRALILCIGMLMQASGTGLVFITILIILMFFYLNGIFIKQPLEFIKRKRIYFITLLFIIIASATFSLAIFRAQNEELYNAMTDQIENRINILLGMEEESAITVNTMDIREKRLKRAESKFLTNGDKKLFGIGYGFINMKEDKTNKILTEDQITMNKVTIGILGNYIYILILISLLISILKKFKYTSNIYIYISTWFFLLLSSFTSNCLLSFGPISLWCMVYSFSLNDYNHKIILGNRKNIRNCTT